MLARPPSKFFLMAELRGWFRQVLKTSEGAEVTSSGAAWERWWWLSSPEPGFSGRRGTGRAKKGGASSWSSCPSFPKGGWRGSLREFVWWVVPFSQSCRHGPSQSGLHWLKGVACLLSLPASGCVDTVTIVPIKGRMAQPPVLVSVLFGLFSGKGGRGSQWAKWGKIHLLARFHLQLNWFHI